MNITFVGCGDAFSEKLGNNSALLKFNSTNLLIDIPDSNYTRIGNLEMDYYAIENIFITHLHGDHINGLERMAYYRKFATPIVKPGTPKPNIYVPEELYFGLWDSAKQGLGYTTEGIKTLEDYFHVHKVSGSFTIKGITFNLIAAAHVPNMTVYGLLVENEFYYSADAIYDKNLIDGILDEVKFVFHDMHMFPQKIEVHASVHDFEHYADEKRNKLYAMHYDDSHAEINEKCGIKLVKPYQTINLSNDISKYKENK